MIKVDFKLAVYTAILNDIATDHDVIIDYVIRMNKFTCMHEYECVCSQIRITYRAIPSKFIKV